MAIGARILYGLLYLLTVPVGIFGVYAMHKVGIVSKI
jgi:hypothetical protein